MRKPGTAGPNELAFACSALLASAAVGCVVPLDSPMGAQDSGPGDAGHVPGDAGAGDASAGDALAGDGSGDSSSPADTSAIDAPVPGDAPPSGSWVNVTSNLANISSECGNMSDVVVKPDEDLVIAGIALKGLWASRDGGMTWTALGQGAGSAAITNRLSSLVFDPTTPTRFWESGLYNGNGVYKTEDDGQTFQALGVVTHNDLVSVDFTDPNRQTLLVGGHETSTLVIDRSTNGGATWTSVAAGLPSNTNCTFPLVINQQTHLVGCGGVGGGPTGIYRSTNGGMTWTGVSTHGGASAPLVASDGSIYWASVNGGGLIRSTDQGVTWSAPLGAGMVASSAPIELPHGVIATIGGRYVVVSLDHGATWAPATPVTPFAPQFSPTGVTYSTRRKAFFIWYFTCGFGGPVPVPPDAIQRYDSVY